MNDKIKAGDVVELKSGGPEMTVDSIGDHQGIESAFCTWFDGNKKYSAAFPLTSLKQATPDVF